MPHPYTEDQLVEQPAIGLFAFFDWQMVLAMEKTSGEGEAVAPGKEGEVVLVDRLRTLEFQGETTLRGIERHRLRELILRDLEIYRKASISEIHGRIGKEIPRRKLQHELKLLVRDGDIRRQGTRRHTVYLWTKKA